MAEHGLNQLQQLEADSVYIIRETASEFQNPVLLYSIGKDSSVLLHLARKAFAPAPITFPILHIDTGYKFKEMYEFRDKVAKKYNLKLIVKSNTDSEAQKMNPEQAHTERYVYLKKTKPLLSTIKENKFDACIGGARREEEKSRAKERVFSLRDEFGAWDPKNQRPGIWKIYNTMLPENSNMRVFPLSNWTEIDVWKYIKQEGIEVVPLYFAKKRKVMERNGIWIEVNENNRPEKGEKVESVTCRFRTLGCSPSTGAIQSNAKTVDEIIAELEQQNTSERLTRAIDHTNEAAMELKKQEGYF